MSCLLLGVYGNYWTHCFFDEWLRYNVPNVSVLLWILMGLGLILRGGSHLWCINNDGLASSLLLRRLGGVFGLRCQRLTYIAPVGSMLLVWKCVCLVSRLCGCVKVMPWASGLSMGDGYMCGCLTFSPWDYVTWYLPSQACVRVWLPAIAWYWCLVPCYCWLLVSGTQLLRDIGVWCPTVVGYWCMAHVEILVYGVPLLQDIGVFPPTPTSKWDTMCLAPCLGGIFYVGLAPHHGGMYMCIMCVWHLPWQVMC